VKRYQAEQPFIFSLILKTYSDRLVISNMRLLNTETLHLKSFFGADLPSYAILSHTWGPIDEEIVFEDVTKGSRSVWEQKSSFKKLAIAVKEAKELGFAWIWIDIVCIDKSSSAELSEAIDSMFSWYQSAEVGIAYLEDIQSEHDFPYSRWFSRGWTLQELITPQRLRFYNASGVYLGTKDGLSKLVESITRVEESVLKFSFEEYLLSGPSNRREEFRD
jgi:hypothetical protein